MTWAPAAVLLPPLVLAQDGSESMEAQGTTPYIGTHFLLFQTSPDGVNGWAQYSETPCVADPQTESFLGFAGEFVRVTVTLGDAIPLSEWSNVEQVLA